MKNLFKNTLVLIALFISGAAFAQSPAHVPTNNKAKTIKLIQTPGEFNKSELKLKAGQPYIFEVTNKGVDHEVGLVVSPKGKTEQKDHIKSAYVTQTVKEGKTEMSNEVVLEAGEYVFFCPMNPTPQYSITVE